MHLHLVHYETFDVIKLLNIYVCKIRHVKKKTISGKSDHGVKKKNSSSTCRSSCTTTTTTYNKIMVMMIKAMIIITSKLLLM